MYRGEAKRDGSYGFLSEVVIRIATREDVVIGISDRREVVLKHLRNYGVLVPERHQNRDLAAWRGVQLSGARWKEYTLWMQFTVQPMRRPDCIDYQIVKAAQQNGDHQRGQQTQ